LLLTHPDIWVNGGAQNPLHVACEKGHAEIVASLLKHPQIDVNKTYRPYLDVPVESYVRGFQQEPKALHIACKKGDQRIIALLLAHPEVYLHAYNEESMTPFAIACAKNDVTTVKMLFNHGSFALEKELFYWDRNIFTYIFALAPSEHPVYQKALDCLSKLPQERQNLFCNEDVVKLQQELGQKPGVIPEVTSSTLLSYTTKVHEKALD
jgi:hypothetical protein